MALVGDTSARSSQRYGSFSSPHFTSFHTFPLPHSPQPADLTHSYCLSQALPLSGDKSISIPMPRLVPPSVWLLTSSRNLTLADGRDGRVGCRQLL